MITRLLSFKYETMQSTVIFRFKLFSYIIIQIFSSDVIYAISGVIMKQN